MKVTRSCLFPGPALWTCLLCMVCATAMAGEAPVSLSAESGDPTLSELSQMNLEQLMSLNVTTGTLTRTQRNLIPGALTVIDKDQIYQANPRSLFELLDIYVPNLHWEYHMWEPSHIGLRGIISDRDDKYLLLVNGRVMNERTHFGALTERDMVLLGDLREVDVIRGPGSAVYGPGAVSMVVNQLTETGLSYQGTGITVRGGLYEEFQSLEFKHGGKSDDRHGYFIYGGVAHYPGADQQYSPIIQGYDFDTSYGTFRHGEPIPYNTIDNNSAYKSNPQIKMHAQIDADDLTLWARYSFGGQNLPITERGWWAGWPTGWYEAIPVPFSGYGYQQVTLFGGYKRALNDKIELDISSSADMTEYERMLLDGFADSYTEGKLISRLLLRWKPNASHELAGGVEYGHYWLGLPSWRTRRLGSVISKFGSDPTPRWQTDMISLVGEHQWRITDMWTTILSARADKHTFTDWLFSPRGALGFTPTDKDTFKLIASRSLRTNFEEEMKFQHDQTGVDSKPEEMTTFELRYERRHSSNLFFAGSIFHNDLDVLGWSGTANGGNGGYVNLGSLQTIGGEVEAAYRTGQTSFTLSHSYVKLLDMSIEDGASTIISAKYLGYGDDLANWPSHITKLTAHHQLSRRWSVDGSVRVEWSFPGDEDFLKYRNDNPQNGPGTPPSSVAGWDEPYGPSVFVNMGCEYRFNNNATLRLDAYNVLGWIDRQLNKRGYLGGIWEGQYRAEAAALGITFRYEF